MEKQQFIEKETEKLNNLIKIALEKFQERESWIKDNRTYKEAGRAIPDSIIEFTKVYLEGLNNIINKL